MEQNMSVAKLVDCSYGDEKDTLDETDSISDLPTVSYRGKRLRSTFSDEDKLPAKFPKRSKEQNNEFLSNIKAQNNLLTSQLNRQEDDVDVFFKSISMTLKKFPSQAINEAKLRVLTMVTQMEDKYFPPANSR